MLIIDEPKLGLHPYALEILAELFESASTNVYLGLFFHFFEFFIFQHLNILDIKWVLAANHKKRVGGLM